MYLFGRRGCCGGRRTISAMFRDLHPQDRSIAYNNNNIMYMLRTSDRSEITWQQKKKN